jgi:hypothetical protein
MDDVPFVIEIYSLQRLIRRVPVNVEQIAMVTVKVRRSLAGGIGRMPGQHMISQLELKGGLTGKNETDIRCRHFVLRGLFCSGGVHTIVPCGFMAAVLIYDRHVGSENTGRLRRRGQRGSLPGLAPFGNKPV